MSSWAILFTGESASQPGLARLYQAIRLAYTGMPQDWRSCGDRRWWAVALKEVGSTIDDIQAMQKSGKMVDLVSRDVLQSDQAVAERRLGA
jgi:hypothetical protein